MQRFENVKHQRMYMKTLQSIRKWDGIKAEAVVLSCSLLTQRSWINRLDLLSPFLLSTQGK
jgi:hypothetical protein